MSDLARFADELATISGRAILPYFRSTLSALDKSGGGAFDPVTEADRVGEAAMREAIRRAYPDHGIVGEEHGAENEGAEHVWVLDPIDGTRAFIAGLPTWGTLIGLTRRGVPAYGVMHQPFTGECFFGDGRASGYRGPDGERALRTRPCADLGEATLLTTTPRLFAGATLHAYDRVERAARLARYGTDCYAYCMVAAGHADLVVEAGLKPYDIVALIPIVEGAGGIVTNWEGGPAAGGGSVVAAGDRRVHEAALRILAG